MSGDNPWKIVGDLFLKLLGRSVRHPERMSDAEWVVTRVWCLLGEVSNGGFDQHFFNSSGNTPVETLQALKAIGARKAAAVFKEACAVFPGGPSPDRDLRWKQLDGLTKAARKRFEPLDRRLYECGQGVVEKLVAYIHSHSNDITLKKERGGRRHT